MAQCYFSYVTEALWDERHSIKVFPLSSSSMLTSWWGARERAHIDISRNRKVGQSEQLACPENHLQKMKNPLSKGTLVKTFLKRYTVWAKLNLHFSPINVNFLGLCLDVMTCSDGAMDWMRMIGWLGSYVPGTANSKSRHMRSFGDTYCSSKEVSCQQEKNKQTKPKF